MKKRKENENIEWSSRQSLSDEAATKSCEANPVDELGEEIS